MTTVVIVAAVVGLAGVLSLAMARGGTGGEATGPASPPASAPRPALERRLERAPARWVDPESRPEPAVPWTDPETSEAAA